MENNSSQLTARQAAEELGFTTRHIQGLIKRGKLSATRDELGNYLIDKTEFYRVFPNAFKAEQERTGANNHDSISRAVLENEVKNLKDLIQEKEKHNQYLREQLDKCNEKETLILETLNSNQRLLEHQSVPVKKNRKKKFGIF